MTADSGVPDPDQGSRRTMLGRDRELAELSRALRSAIDGKGAGLVLRGAHGIGLSRLLTAATETLGPQVRVVQICGVPAEAELPGAGLQRLALELHELHVVRPIGPENFDPEPGGQLARGLQLLDLLIRTAAGCPLVCLVDDAHELDHDSLAALGLAGRRLAHEPVLLLIATTAAPLDQDPLAGLPTLEPARLSEAESRELLTGLLTDDGTGEVASDVLTVVTDLGQGNPLALHELAGALTWAQLHAGEPLPTGLPSDSRLRGHHRRRLAQLPIGVRRVLLVAAAQQPLDLGTLLRAATAVGFELADIDVAARSQLLRIDGDRVEVPDRLLRDCGYQEAGVAERLAVHRVLAEVLEHDGHRLDRAWHRAMSAAVRDSPGSAVTEDLAAELFASATAVLRADGDRLAAARCLERSAALTGQTGRAAQHLAQAARAAWLGGDVRRARLLIGRARPLACGAALRSSVDLLAGEIELRSGSPERADEALTMVAAGLSGPFRKQAVTALLRVSEVYMLAGDHARYVSVAHRIGRLDRPDDSLPTRLMFEQFTGFAATFLGEHSKAVGPLRTVVELGPLLRDPAALILATMAAMTLGDGVGSQRSAARAVAAARAQQGGAQLPVALEFLAFNEFWCGQFTAASAHAREGMALADRAGQDNSVVTHLAILALLSTLPGTSSAALDRARGATRRAGGRGLGRPQALTTWAAVRMALATGRLDGLAAELRAATAPVGGSGSGGMHLTVKVMATPDLVEAAVRQGTPELTASALKVFETWAVEMGSTAMQALLARCHALISPDDDAAEEHFRHALGLHDEAGLEFERARTQLLYGRALRRRRRPGLAREHLQEALQVFDGLAAWGWATQAHAELRAAGGTGTLSPTPRAWPEHNVRVDRVLDVSHSSYLDQGNRAQQQPQLGIRSDQAGLAGRVTLTPQQSEIARLVAGGATNREVAAQLFLSPRTVDHHLRNIFVRLGVRSRVELSRLVS